MNDLSEELLPVEGNTYPVKEKLKRLGAEWDGYRKVWMIPASKHTLAMQCVADPEAEVPGTEPTMSVREAIGKIYPIRDPEAQYRAFPRWLEELPIVREGYAKKGRHGGSYIQGRDPTPDLNKAFAILETARGRMEAAEEGWEKGWHRGFVVYWQAILFILEAAELVGDDGLPELPRPSYADDVPTAQDEVEQFGREVLAKARQKAGVSEEERTSDDEL